MKTYAIFVILVLCCVLGACGFVGKQIYYCDPANVQSIQIITLEALPENPNEIYTYSVIREISDTSEFVKKINELDYHMNWGEPAVLQIGYTLIKINYFNGDFDLLHYSAQKFLKNNCYQTGFFRFDKKQFNQLLAHGAQ